MHNLHEQICDYTKDTKRARDFFREKLAFTINPDRLAKMIEENLDKFSLFDLRDYEDYMKGHIPYAIHMPMDQLEEQLEHFSKDKVSIFYGYSYLCQRQQLAAYFLADKGYPVKELLGGFKGWKKRDFDIIEND